MKRLFKHIYNACASYLALHQLRRSNKIGRHVLIHKNAVVGTGCILGNNVIVGRGTKLGNNVQIGNGVRLERITIGDNSVIEGRVLITGFGDGSIHIGRDSYVGPDTALDFSASITIGNFVHIAGLSTGLWTHSSALMCINGIPLKDKSVSHRPTARIVIEDNSYIGGNCTIFPGILIGNHSVVAPNSAVTKDVAPFSLVGGVPAKFIKSTEPMIENKPFSDKANE